MDQVLVNPDKIVRKKNTSKFNEEIDKRIKEMQEYKGEK